MIRLIKLLQEIEIDLGYTPEILDRFNEKLKQEYLPLIGTSPIYDKLDSVTKDNKRRILLNITEIVKDNRNDYGDDEDNLEDMIIDDSIDREITRFFFPQFIQNLLKEGFKWTGEDWIVPKKYQKRRTNIGKIGEVLTCYGMIWGIWGVDYDTIPGEVIGENFEKACEEYFNK